MLRSTLLFHFILTSVCCAQSPGGLLDKYAGTWRLNPSASDNIDKAIEEAIAPMNFIARPIARGRLKSRNAPFPTVSIKLEGSGVRVAHEAGLTASYPGPGSTVRTTAPDGTDVHTRFTTDPVLVFTYEADSGKREDRYELSGDNSAVTIFVRLTSPKLPRPVAYKLVFNRSQ
ncbi:MAG: hypothetical protein H7Y20_19435 [Bryobacteraceae bacterium]|nr:hypothetical protein [Bryobacteraceae bacterium]